MTRMEKVKLAKLINANEELIDILDEGVNNAGIINTDKLMDKLLVYFKNNDSGEIYSLIDITGTPIIRRLIKEYIPFIEEHVQIEPRKYSYEHYVICLTLLGVHANPKLSVFVKSALNYINTTGCLSYEDGIIFNKTEALKELVEADISGLMMVLLIDERFNVEPSEDDKVQLYNLYKEIRVRCILDNLNIAVCEDILNKGIVNDILLIIIRCGDLG